MVGRISHRRLSDTDQTFPANIRRGELAINTASRQLYVGDAVTGALKELIGIRTWDSLARYAAQDMVVYDGLIYQAITAIDPGEATPNANPTMWGALDAADVANKINRSGDTMQGDLTLNSDPTSDLMAATKQYVDAQVATQLDEIEADARYSSLGHGHVATEVGYTDPIGLGLVDVDGALDLAVSRFHPDPVSNPRLEGDTLYFTVNGAWAKPAGLVGLKVHCYGGGGGAGYARGISGGLYAAGGGGGGGGYSTGWIPAADLPANVTVTVGAGGAGAQNDVDVAQAGGVTSFDTFLQAPGGNPGVSLQGDGADANADGGAGGNSFGGTHLDINVSGAAGVTGLAAEGSKITIGGMGGAGAGPLGGPGGRERISSGNGRAGSNYGGGGSAGTAQNDQDTYFGGSGAPGLVVVTEYF